MRSPPVTAAIPSATYAIAPVSDQCDLRSMHPLGGDDHEGHREDPYRRRHQRATAPAFT